MIDDGGPAFPTPNSERPLGMSLRDFFAAAALAGLLYDSIAKNCGVYARQAYELADAMLKERSRGNEPPG